MRLVPGFSPITYKLTFDSDTQRRTPSSLSYHYSYTCNCFQHTAFLLSPSRLPLAGINVIHHSSQRFRPSIPGTRPSPGFSGCFVCLVDFERSCYPNEPLLLDEAIALKYFCTRSLPLAKVLRSLIPAVKTRWVIFAPSIGDHMSKI